MNYQHILVPVDGSDISLAAARQAAHIAKAFGSKLTAISLVALDPFSGVDFYYISPVVKIILLKHVLMQKNSRKS